MPPRRKKTSAKTNKTTTKHNTPMETRSGNRNNRIGKVYWINEFNQRIAYIEWCKVRFPGKDNAFFDDEIKQFKLWKSVIKESSERDVLTSKGSLEQRFNDEKIKYDKKISKLEVKLAEMKIDYDAMQLDNDEKEQKIILLDNEIASLSGDG
ncbi:15070_t:CDS:2, partial [Racocetra fulgida]